MLARDRTTIVINSGVYTLRPSLRAAIRLEGSIGLTKALADVYDGNVTTMLAVIAESARDDHDPVRTKDQLKDWSESFSRPTMGVNMAAAREPLTRLILAMLGIDPNAEPKPAKASGTPPKPVSEQLAQLYRQGTGWLGWTPSVTLDATPTEIVEAFKGHVEMLTAIHGAKEAEPEPVDLDTKAKAIFGGLAQRFRDRNPVAA